MQQSNSQTSKTILIVLIVALLLSITFSAIYLIPRYRTLNHNDPEDVEKTINQALDTVTIKWLISEFQTRNDGAYPSSQYLTETMSPYYPLFYETIQIKGEDDNPSTTAWPKIRELHVWTGYVCVDNEKKYAASEIKYEEFIRKDPEEFTIIGASMASIIALGRDADYEYMCS